MGLGKFGLLFLRLKPLGLGDSHIPTFCLLLYAFSKNHDIFPIDSVFYIYFRIVLYIDVDLRCRSSHLMKGEALANSKQPRPTISGAQKAAETNISQSGSKAPWGGRIPKIILCRILMFMWSFEVLYLTHNQTRGSRSQLITILLYSLCIACILVHSNIMFCSRMAVGADKA